MNLLVNFMIIITMENNMRKVIILTLALVITGNPYQDYRSNYTYHPYPSSSIQQPNDMQLNNNIPVYDTEKCIGPIVMGVCHGQITGRPDAICHGQMLNGVCTGPMF